MVEVYIRELLKLVLNNAIKRNQKVSLFSIYNKLESNLRALEALGVTYDKCAAMWYPLVQSSLPDDLLRALKTKELKHRVSMKFLQEVENEERISMAIESFSKKDETLTNKDKSKMKNKLEKQIDNRDRTVFIKK